MLIGFFYPHAKVKTNIKAIKPLKMEKTKAWKRPDTDEILLLEKNTETHFSRWLITSPKEEANCELDKDSGIRTTKDVQAGHFFRLYLNGWQWVRNEDLPQYTKFKQMKRNYGFDKNARGRKQIKIQNIREVIEDGKVSKSYENCEYNTHFPLFHQMNQIMGVSPQSPPDVESEDLEALESLFKM